MKGEAVVPDDGDDDPECVIPEGDEFWRNR